MRVAGRMPVMNREVVEKAIKLGLALDAKINQKNVFDRKTIFYPDLPKGYQISQLDLPIVEHGKLEIVVGDEVKTINVTRAHMEEDAGKSVHEGLNGATGIDLNRAGTPLLEVVSEPKCVLQPKPWHTLKHCMVCNLVGYLRRQYGGRLVPRRCQRSVRPKVRLSSVHAVKSKTSILSASWNKPSIMKWKRKSKSWKTAVKYSRQPCCLTLKRRNPCDAFERRCARLPYFPDVAAVIISDSHCKKAKEQMPELPHEMAARLSHYGISGYDASVDWPRAQAAY